MLPSTARKRGIISMDFFISMKLQYEALVKPVDTVKNRVEM